MTARKSDQFFFVIGLASVLLGCNRHSLTVDDVIERNTQAVGGRAAIEAIHSIEINLHITDPGFEVDGIYHAARPGRMRIDVQAGGKQVFTEAFDGQQGWQSHDQSEPEPASPKAAAALRHGVELPGKLFGLHEMKQRRHKIDLVGRETVDGIDYYVLRLTFGDGYTTSLYVDPQSWLITRRRDVRPLHVDVDPTPTTIEQRISDFREVASVRFAFASTEIDLKTGKQLESTKVGSIKVNPPIDELIFKKL
jgi:hypothetical protein